MYLKRMPSLMNLWLADTNVTDSGLAQLKGLANLDQLNLRGTKVTDAGVSELRKLMPELKVTR